MGNYVISQASRLDSGRVVVQVVTDRLQRVSVTIPYGVSTAEGIGEVLDHALAAIPRPSKPLSAHPKGNPDDGH